MQPDKVFFIFFSRIRRRAAYRCIDRRRKESYIDPTHPTHTLKSKGTNHPLHRKERPLLEVSQLTYTLSREQGEAPSTCKAPQLCFIHGQSKGCSNTWDRPMKAQSFRCFQTLPAPRTTSFQKLDKAVLYIFLATILLACWDWITFWLQHLIYLHLHTLVLWCMMP